MPAAPTQAAPGNDSTNLNNDLQELVKLMEHRNDGGAGVPMNVMTVTRVSLRDLPLTHEQINDAVIRCAQQIQQNMGMQ